MTTKAILRASFGVLLLLITDRIAVAAEPGMTGVMTFDCSKDSTSESKFFGDIQNQARRINLDYCEQLRSKVPSDEVTLSEIEQRLPAFGDLVLDTVREKLTIPQLGNMRKQTEVFRDTLAGEVDNRSKLPNLQISRKSTITGGVERSYFFGANQTNVQKINKNNRDACHELDDSMPDCDAYLNDLKDAIEPYQLNANAFNVYKTRVQLSGLAQTWDRYFETARYQNSAGIALTTLFEKSHFDQDFLVGPPARQWHALQPGIVIENVEAAADGENIEYALSIEWIGVNWWKDSFIGMPFGISLASVYTDRPGIKDLGHGIMFHFANQYTIGVTDHDGDEGVFVTLDVLKLFQNKKQQLKKYQQEVRDLL